MMQDAINIERADISDSWKILNLQKLAFRSEAELYNDYSIHPMTQTIGDIKAEFEAMLFLKVMVGEEIVGSVRVGVTEGIARIEKLMVHPDFQGRGIGTRLMEEAEKLCAGAERIELFTGHKSKKNISLYEKLGYENFKIEVIKDDMYFVYMRKLLK